MRLLHSMGILGPVVENSVGKTPKESRTSSAININYNLIFQLAEYYILKCIFMQVLYHLISLTLCTNCALLAIQHGGCAACHLNSLLSLYSLFIV